MVQQQQPRLPAQKFGRPSTQQPPRQQFTGQQSFIQNQNAQTNTQLSGPRQSTVSIFCILINNSHNLGVLQWVRSAYTCFLHPCNCLV